MLPTMQLSYLIYPAAHPEYNKKTNPFIWSVEWFQAQVEQLGFKNFVWIENVDTDTQACICTKGMKLYLIFRGSSTDEDWTTNFDIELIPCPFGAVHKGFWEDTLSVYDRIQNEIQSYVQKGYKFIISGHSQGAAVACTTAIKLLSDDIPIDLVIHYGGPRVADFPCAEYLDTTYPGLFHRVVNNNDVVTRIAPRILGYSHFGKLHYFKGEGVYTDNISEWRRFLDRLRYKLDFGGEYGLDILNDHKPSHYLSLIKQLLENK